MQALGSTGVKVIRNELNPIARALTEGLGAPTSARLNEASKISKVPIDKLHPPSSDKPGSTLSPTDTQLLTRSGESNLSSADIIGGTTLLRQTFRPKETPSESSVETTPGKNSETIIHSSSPTRLGSVVQGALTEPLPKSESSETHISQVLSPVADHEYHIRDMASAYYSVAHPPLSSNHARAMHTMTDKPLKVDISEVEDPAVVKAHLDPFRRNGAAFLIPADKHAKFCKTHVGHAGDNAQFVTNKAQLDKVIIRVAREGGTQAQMETRLEELLGIDKGTWKDLLVGVYKEKNLDKIGLRFVSGKEALANSQYSAGGVTQGGPDGGLDEAIVNMVPVDQVEFVPLLKYAAILLEKDSKPAPAPKSSIPVSSMVSQYQTVLP